MKIKAFLSDFDGTLVNKDILDVVCGICGKEKESRMLNEEFIAGKREGLPTLKQRIDYLSGISLDQISKKLDERNYLIDGAEELFEFLTSHNIITILHSGNITPVLKYYQKLLNIDYVLGTSPRMIGNVIQGIEVSDFGSRDFKVKGCEGILEQLGIDKSEVVCIGDAPSDSDIFDLSAVSIAINPKGNIAEKADYVIHDSLKNAITILEKIIAE